MISGKALCQRSRVLNSRNWEPRAFCKRSRNKKCKGGEPGFTHAVYRRLPANVVHFLYLAKLLPVLIGWSRRI